MTLKLIGAVVIFLSCGAVGFGISATQRREEKYLHELISALEYMEWELQYRLMPLPDLCNNVAHRLSGNLRSLFLQLSCELEGQIAPDAGRCMDVAISKCKHFPNITYTQLQSLGKSLGRFDLQGQLLGLESVQTETKRLLDNLRCNQDVRLRSYQTLGLCAGAALVIIFI